MKPIWRRSLWCLLIVLVIGAGVRGYSAWRTQQFVQELERHGTSLVRLGDDVVLLESHSSDSMTVEDVERLSPLERYTLADFSASGVSDSVVRALMEANEGTLGLRLNETHTSDAAFDLSRFDRWVSHLDLSHTQVTNASLPRLHRFKQWPLGYLSLAHTNLGDSIFETFSERVDLKGQPGGEYISGPTVLNLTNTQVTDDGLKMIRYSPHGLVLKDTAITDIGLLAMKFDELVYLDLTNTKITDAGLAAFADLKRLRLLRLSGTQITVDGLKQLNQLCPNVCVMDRQPEGVLPRHRLVDAMCHGQLFGRISDELWQDLLDAGKRNTNYESVSVGVADKIEEGHVVLDLRVDRPSKVILTAELYVPCW